jgi:GNAT superfamily N-acetyltransferase
MATVRPAFAPAGPGELDEALEVMAGAFGTTVEGLAFYRWVRASPQGVVLLARDRGVAVATAAAISFGATGWIGGVSVRGSARRAGLGTAATEACVDWLEERGARTTLLLATDAGARVYRRLGFSGEGDYLTFEGPARRALGPPRGLHRGRDVRDALAIDAAATGEDRSVLLRAADRWHLAVGRDGRPAGYHVGGTWPGGASVALDPAVGPRLVDAARTRNAAAVRISVPAANAAALAALAERSFGVVGRTERMRLGPPLAWRPDAIWGVFNLFCG